MKLLETKVIYGCEARGDAQSPYLTRYTLLATRWFQLCIHKFHRSDSPDLHDHPWDFLTLPLRHGYREQYATAPGAPYATAQRNCKVGRLYYRAAEHTHRVILHKDFELVGPDAVLTVKPRQALTLVLMLRRRREWGFFSRGVWQLWTDYFAAKGC